MRINVGERTSSTPGWAMDIGHRRHQGKNIIFIQGNEGNARKRSMIQKV